MGAVVAAVASASAADAVAVVAAAGWEALGRCSYTYPGGNVGAKDTAPHPSRCDRMELLCPGSVFAALSQFITYTAELKLLGV